LQQWRWPARNQWYQRVGADLVEWSWDQRLERFGKLEHFGWQQLDIGGRVDLRR
jgi:hypothetical protein